MPFLKYKLVEKIALGWDTAQSTNLSRLSIAPSFTLLFLVGEPRKEAMNRKKGIELGDFWLQRKLLIIMIFIQLSSRLFIDSIKGVIIAFGQHPSIDCTSSRLDWAPFFFLRVQVKRSSTKSVVRRKTILLVVIAKKSLLSFSTFWVPTTATKQFKICFCWWFSGIWCEKPQSFRCGRSRKDRK